MLIFLILWNNINLSDPTVEIAVNISLYLRVENFSIKNLHMKSMIIYLI